MSNIMEGPRDLWVPLGCEYKGGDALPHPVFARAAYRKGEPADGFTQLRDQIADVLDSWHPMDYYPVRVLIRAWRNLKNVLFGAGEHREMMWVAGCVLVAVSTAIFFRIVGR